ncbi:DUF1850 domain-containing protein [Marinobacter sp. LV10MA510-1]|uniref:DUF1850 domain-containing protein n=1 Tax=Marinobacter sp. LV10MA510-1 TaxID=1415567 RepID=UPI000BF8B440|nr:DUF1850 domain-containing protein [Marinobacter sp. LV10MA510-1]PFG07993.1 uncharacterized protein DUF1850 [Marinobacter sp. LV10MA510-1]
MERQCGTAPSRFAIARRLQAALLLMCLPLAGAGAPPAPAISSDRLQVVTDQGEMLVDIAVLPGMRWCIEWNHSVKKFAVLDCYRNVAGVMQLERSHQPDFAAGLGHTVGRGEQVSDGEGGYWINEIDEPVVNNRYVLRVGADAVNHRVVWLAGDSRWEVSLSDQASGQRVTIQLIKPASPSVNYK